MVVKRKRRGGKKKLPDDQRRVLIAARVTPATHDFLRALPESNIGRAIDSVVDLVGDPELLHDLKKRRLVIS